MKESGPWEMGTRWAPGVLWFRQGQQGTRQSLTDALGWQDGAETQGGPEGLSSCGRLPGKTTHEELCKNAQGPHWCPEEP